MRRRVNINETLPERSRFLQRPPPPNEGLRDPSNSGCPPSLTGVLIRVARRLPGGLDQAPRSKLWIKRRRETVKWWSSVF